jgi:hypothetical protein
MNHDRDILIICDSHIFSVRRHIGTNPIADRVTYLPTLFYRSPWKTLQEGLQLEHDPDGQYSIPVEQFEDRVRSSELVAPGRLDLARFSKIIFFGHFLVDRCIARTLKGDVFLYPDVMSRPSAQASKQGHYLSWPAYAHLVRANLELHVVLAMKSIAATLDKTRQEMLCVPGPAIRQDVVTRVVGADRSAYFHDMRRILATQHQALVDMLAPLDIRLPDAGWQNYAIDSKGFLLSELSVGPGDVHANADFGLTLFNQVLLPFINPVNT